MPEDFSEECDERFSMGNESQQQLNRFLQLRDVSPVGHVLSVPWNTTHERTKRQHLRKAEQFIFAMRDVIAPKKSKKLWKELCDRHSACREAGRRRGQK